VALTTRDDLFSLPEVELLARLVELEAGGETRTGQVAVACVPMTRHKIGGWFGATIKDVCLKPAQFSCFNDGPGGLLHRALTEPASIRCHEIASLALIGLLKDPTGGCDHYCRHDAWPTWRSKAAGDGLMKVVIQIGDHVFFNNKVRA